MGIPDPLDISFSLIRDNDGMLSGFSIRGIAEHYAECFCFSFPLAQSKGWARVEFQGTTLVFVHDGTNNCPEISDNIYMMSGPGRYETELNDEDATLLKDLLNKRGQYVDRELNLTMKAAWGKGFELKSETT